MPVEAHHLHSNEQATEVPPPWPGMAMKRKLWGNHPSLSHRSGATFVHATDAFALGAGGAQTAHSSSTSEGRPSQRWPVTATIVLLSERLADRMPQEIRGSLKRGRPLRAAGIEAASETCSHAG